MKKGLVIIYTGNGKGKTTAALGLALRALGWGKKVLMIQFVKRTLTGEHKAVKKFLKGKIKIYQLGKGWVRVMGDRKPLSQHKEAASKALEYAREETLSRKNWDVIILDEVLGAIKAGLIKEEVVVDLIKNKQEGVDFVLTGRGASSKIIKLADLVTEMKKIKHPFDLGTKAKKGIDF